MKVWKALSAFAAFVMAACLGSCHPHDHPHSDDAAPEPNTSQVTVWEGGLEAFIENEYPVVNVPVRFITHISDVATGQPRREGGIVFELVGPAGESLEHPDARPARDGIYLPSIAFPAVGFWKVAVRVPMNSGPPKRISLPNITVYESAEKAQAADPQVEPDGVSFLKEQQWKLSMLTAMVSKKTLSARRKFPGHVLAKTGNRVSLSSPVAGRLVAVEGRAFPNRGQVVAEGTVLALIEPALPSEEILALAIKLAEAEAEELRTAQVLKLANATLARVERLQKVNAKSPRELERARFEAEAAKSAHEAAIAVKKRYAAARAYVDSHRRSGGGSAGGFGPVELRAPISGTVIRVSKAPGERVSPGETLFVILDASALFVEVNVPQYEAIALGPKPKAYLEPHRDHAPPPGREHTGDAERLPLSLLYAGLEVVEGRHSVPLLYEVDNEEGLLRVGMPVGVFVEIAAPREAVAVPESALVDEDGKYVVFVQIAGETFERRDLSIGIRDSGWVEVVDGVVEGERVVISDPWSIRLASLSTAIPAHGHEH